MSIQNPALDFERERRWLVWPDKIDELHSRAAKVTTIQQAQWGLNRKLAQQVADVPLIDPSKRLELNRALLEALEKRSSGAIVRLRFSDDQTHGTLLSIKTGRGHNQREFPVMVDRSKLDYQAFGQPLRSLSKVRHSLSLADVFGDGASSIANDFEVVSDQFVLARSLRVPVTSAGSSKLLTFQRGKVGVVEVEQIKANDRQAELFDTLVADHRHNANSVLQVEITEFSGVVSTIAEATALRPAIEMTM